MFDSPSVVIEEMVIKVVINIIFLVTRIRDTFVCKFHKQIKKP